MPSCRFGSGLVLLIAFIATRSAHVEDLEQNYNYHSTLDGQGKYDLYWSFDLERENITFAVRVQTEGWIGFGLSPNGQMPQSDVVIGWVDGQQSYFNDRFADDRITPPIDEQQDWRLLSAEEEGGYTILEFTRNFITCDDRDLPITPETARVIWSYGNSDPPSSDPSQSIARHDEQGTRSLNLLGGARSTFEEPENITSFSLTSDEVLVPNNSDTTYWCTVLPLPDVAKNQEVFVYRTSPIITENNEEYVHHFLVYLCPPGQEVTTGDCGNLTQSAQACRDSTLIGAWAVGGEDFEYPEGVALPLGGPAFVSDHILIEVHYNNEQFVSGIVDSSGLEFFYTTKEPVHRAGVLFVGASVSPLMVIPPGQDKYIVTGECSSQCLDQYLPEEGITVFASLLHTHLQGVAVTHRHRTYNDECGVTEEVEPIDQNLRYDFNYQDIAHLPKEQQIKKGDNLLVECTYQTLNKESATLGGLGTNDEMCLAFVFYYPQINLSTCLSFPVYHETYPAFFSTQLSINDTLAYGIISSLEQGSDYYYRLALGYVDWTPEAVDDLNELINSPAKYEVCSAAVEDEANGESFYSRTALMPDCSYESPNQCTNYQPQSCCDRLKQVEPQASPSPTPDADGAGGMVVSVTTIALLLLAIVMLV